MTEPKYNGLVDWTRVPHAQSYGRSESATGCLSGGVSFVLGGQVSVRETSYLAHGVRLTLNDARRDIVLFQHAHKDFDALVFKRKKFRICPGGTARQ